MKKKLLSITVLLAIVFGSCATAKKANSSKDVTYIKMERTNCFGTCPNYVIEIYKSGLVRYTGRLYAQPDGTYEKNIGTAKTDKILKEASAYRMDTCKELYEAVITDVPAIVYDLKMGSKEKHIGNANFGPDFLKELARKMDAIGKPTDTGWKKTASYKKPE